MTDIVDDNLLLHGTQYNIIRTDRVNGRGGGTCLFVSNTIPFIKNEIVHNSSDISCIDLITPSEKIRIILVYRPNTKETIKEFKSMLEILYEISAVSFPFIVLGDFNMPNIKWENYSTLTKNNKETLFLEYLQSFELKQNINKPTRGENILDLVLCNEENLIRNITINPPIGNSDHNTIDFEISLTSNFNDNIYKFPNFRKANYTLINAYFSSINWNLVFSQCLDINHLYSIFQAIIYDAIYIYIPESKIKCNNLKKPEHIQKMTLYLKTLWQQKSTPELTRKISYVSKRIDFETKKFLKNREKHKTQTISQKFSYISSFLKTKHRKITSILDENKHLVYSDNRIAQMLSTKFSSVFNINCLDNSDLSSKTTELSCQSVIITEHQIFDLLSKLPEKNNTSYDSIPCIFLKKCAKSLYYPLYYIFSNSLMTSTLPETWKQSIIIPIPKTSKTPKVDEFRPVSLLCSITKVIEQIIAKHMSIYAEQNGILPDCQHGFRPNKSVTTQLIEFQDDISFALDNKNIINIVYFDLAKAFDSISHERLLIKLKLIGIESSLLKWISNYLYNRKSVVKIGNEFSKQFSITSGVPQGSILGPLLFNIYISDMPKLCDTPNIKIKLFADDVKAYQILSKTNSNYSSLQIFINKFIQYCNTNGLNISLQKCSVLYIGKSNPKIDYFIGNHKIFQINNEDKNRDLGIFFTSKFKFNKHIQTISLRANRNCFALIKSLKSHDPKILIEAFNVYVRSILEFGSQVWNSLTRNNIKQLEDIQKRYLRFTYKRITKVKIQDIPSYKNLLQYFKVESLEHRRLKADLKLFHQHIFGKIKIKHNNSYLIRQTKTRGEKYKIQPTRCSTMIRYNSFFIRTARIYTLIPIEIRKNTPKMFSKLLAQLDISTIIK